jgi:hypothetical protein
MNSLSKAIAIIFLAVAIVAFAQQSGSNSQHQDQSMQGMQGMHGGQNQQVQMGGMMQNCQGNMRDMEQRHEKLRTEIESAKQSTVFSRAGLCSATDVSAHCAKSANALRTRQS